jgi:hypothetical protein
MEAAPRPVDMARSAPFLAGLFVLALVAFWPTYLSSPGDSSSGYTHLHAVTAALWMIVLITQPFAVLTDRMRLHRALGRSTFVLAPAVVVSILLLAHHSISHVDPAQFDIQAYVLYLQLSLASVFAICYGLAILNRRDTPVHSRFMVATALTLIDPVVIRLMFWIAPAATWNYQWFTFALTDLVLVALILVDRKEPRVRWVYAFLLGLFVLSQAPAVLGPVGDPYRGAAAAPAWQAVAHWFASLSLS